MTGLGGRASDDLWRGSASFMFENREGAGVGTASERGCRPVVKIMPQTKSTHAKETLGPIICFPVKTK